MASEIHILSNVNIAGIERRLEAAFADVAFRMAPFDQVTQQLLDPPSPLNTGHPDRVLVYLDAARTFGCQAQGMIGFGEAEALASRQLDELLGPISEFLTRHPNCRVLVNTIAYHISSCCLSLGRNLCFHNSAVDAFNLGLCRWRAENLDPRVTICDWAARVQELGAGILYDERLWHIGRMPFGARGLDELANLYAQYLRALSERTGKVLVLDLDNTLWGGVVGEESIGGIALGQDGVGSAYRDFQARVRALKDRGVLLAIASRNNECDVDAVFREHPMMVLRPDDFVVRKIGWRPKPEMLAEMSEELSLGLGSFVLIDDSPAERDLVRAHLPDVAVPEFPADPFTLGSWFAGVAKEHFDSLLLTDEDRRRTDIYRADVRRSRASADFSRLDDFYRSLEMKMRVWIDHREQAPRLAQLTQKTNQFNLTTRRYGVTEIEEMTARPDVRLYDIELSDRYGSNGIVGLVITRLSDESAEIDTFLLSCRVIGRNVESALFAFVVNDLHALGIHTISARFIPTERNAPISGLLDQLGFEAGDDLRTFTITPMVYPDYIEVETT